MDKTTDATFKNVPFPFDSGIETDVAEDPNNNEVQAEEEETTDDDSESWDVSKQSLVFAPSECLMPRVLSFAATDFSPNNLFAIRLCTIVNWAGPKKL